jgi:diguanylate cyclase (GGDEF)-like protein
LFRAALEIYTRQKKGPKPADRSQTGQGGPPFFQTQTRLEMIKKASKKKSGIPQEQRPEAPPGWDEVQDKLAAAAGLSILLIEGHQPPALVVSNNNSICHAFQSSPKYVGLCDPYCGEAHRRAMNAGGVAHYKCHAGLECITMPIEIDEERTLAAIGGRAFTTSADYRSIVERLREGDLKDLLQKDPFQNVIFAEQPRLDALAGRLEKAARDYKRSVSGPPPLATSDAAPSASQSAPDMQKEIEQLRSQLEHRAHFAESLQNFLERISSRDPEKTYLAILKNSKELLQAERASLLVLDEAANELTLKASIGLAIENAEVGRIRMGEGIAGQMLETGKPLLVDNIDLTDLRPAPVERKYKTKSFISYPLTIGGRKIGVLNVTDKQGGGKYDEVDLSLLEIIGSQAAVALERAEWQERATEFQLMSITDSLTGLLNRRYLEERLNEELNRSKRSAYPMSFLMIDIDDFKSYNDINGHQAGDLALQMTAHNLKAALRSADVACRYGGEEFSVLLPQTTPQEAAVIADRMRQRVASTSYPNGKAQALGAVTVSIGVSNFSKHIDTPERVIAAADRALYYAKSQGKNRIEFYDDNLAGLAKTNEGK